jgi:tetratricopeptide (TPR) repeat protein
MTVLLISMLVCVVIASQHGNEDAHVSPSAPAEPSIAKYAVFEGVLEPFRRVDNRRRENTASIREAEAQGEEEEVPWRVMKRHADSLAAAHPPQLQAALAEYSQLIRHPDTFSEMPASQRYDAFLSMARILKMMGHYQKAELLLFEALTHSEDPSEAHLQLALLYIDGEDLERAKVHIKNCLFHKEADVSMLVHLTVVLICQGRIQEARFYTSRVLSLLESRLQQQHMSSNRGTASSMQIHHQNFLSGIEDLVGRVFHCEYRFVPSAAPELFRLFTSLHSWMTNGEMSGRFLFDLGQALYESGRPRVGLSMMRSGHLDSERGVVTEPRTTSTEVVSLRTGLEFPPIPESVGKVLQSYINITSYLVSTSNSFLRDVSLENIQDVYWPLPLLQGSGLPISPVIRETLSRFEAPVLMKLTPPNNSNSAMEQRMHETGVTLGNEPTTNIINSDPNLGNLDENSDTWWDKVREIFSIKGGADGAAAPSDVRGGEHASSLHKPKPSVSKRNSAAKSRADDEKDSVSLVHVGKFYINPMNL